MNVCVSHASKLKRVTMKLARLQPWMVIFLPLLTVRVLSAFYSNISDCDETFNYWEPLHYLLHGTGFQTWEYSPVHGIRSYAYIALHSLPLIPFTGLAKVLQHYSDYSAQFYILRVLLAALCAVCEAYFIRSVTKATGVRMGFALWLVMLTSCGMFIASAAFLPSSFSMYCAMVAFGAWISNNSALAVLATSLGALVGWPFSAVLGVPIALDVVLLQQKLPAFLGWCAAALALILGPVVAVDSYYYGRLLCAPLNIVLYNVFGAGGPELYGTEPWSYYFVNGALNFNVLFPVALAAPPLALVKVVTSGTSRWSKSGHKYSCGILLALALWLVIFMTRPHKEERFLFPVYPLVCFAVTYGIERVEGALVYLSGRRHRRVKDIFGPAVFATIFIHGLLSVLRVLALYNGYHAPLDVYPQLRAVQHELGPGGPAPLNLCVGKEWHRFPSAFLLPSQRWRLRFVPSEFRAQLPQPFVAPPPEGTRVVPTHFNDMNKEEPTQYFNISQCHFLVDLEVPRETPREPRYSLDTQHWEVVVRQPFLDTVRSHRFFRAFYIPWVSPKMCHMADYVVLRNRQHSSWHRKH